MLRGIPHMKSRLPILIRFLLKKSVMPRKVKRRPDPIKARPIFLFPVRRTFGILDVMEEVADDREEDDRCVFMNVYIQVKMRNIISMFGVLWWLQKYIGRQKLQSTKWNQGTD
mmetsp:Transcript_47289/g.71541  ORF Transcript_47289/g.71541 Transcript_47289/m.71541 type:complete len:113 (+) Transcript_47289:382-720(+)